MIASVAAPPRAIYVAGLRNEFELVAVNAAADLRSNAT
jgi:hypothetical protein